MQILTKENFILYCMHHYDNPQCQTTKEFEDDLNKVMYLQRLFTRYLVNDDLNEKLIINHLIVLFNLFNEATINILFYKLDKQYWSLLITFLIYLNRMPDVVPQYGIVTSDWNLDNNVLEVLGKI